MQTTTKQNLKFHDLTHTKEKKNVCDVCGQRFSLMKNLRRHMKLHLSKEKDKYALYNTINLSHKDSV